MVICMCLCTGQFAYSAITSPVTVYSGNNRYLAIGGVPVVLMGVGTPMCEVKNHNWQAEIDAGIAANCNYIRIWHIMPWDSGESYFPWARSGSGTALDGGGKFNLTQWDTTYWTNLKNCCAYAQSKGMIVSIMLFDECSYEANSGSNTKWGGHPFHPSNNVNSLGLPSGDAVPEFYALTNTKVLALQEAYAAKMITETSGYPNVIYEMCNEYTGPWDWEKHWIDFVRSRCSNIIAVNRLGSIPGNYWTDPSINDVNFHWGSMDPATVNKNMAGYTTSSSTPKAINYDETVENSTYTFPTYRKVGWTSFVGGGHFHFEGDSLDSQPNNAVKYLMGFIKSNGVQFWAMKPSNSLVTATPGGSAYTLAKAGSEYVTYVVGSGSGNMTISLQSGVTYTAKAYNPSTGAYTNLTINGNTVSGIPSYSTDIVVYIKSSGTPVTTTPNIALTLATDKTQALPGDTVTYTLTYKNTGSGDAKTVAITNPVPTYTTYVTGSASSGGVYSSTARNLTWSISTVPAGGTGTLTFKVTID